MTGAEKTGAEETGVEETGAEASDNRSYVRNINVGFLNIFSYHSVITKYTRAWWTTGHIPSNCIYTIHVYYFRHSQWPCENITFLLSYILSCIRDFTVVALATYELRLLIFAHNNFVYGRHLCAIHSATHATHYVLHKDGRVLHLYSNKFLLSSIDWMSQLWICCMAFIIHVVQCRYYLYERDPDYITYHIYNWHGNLATQCFNLELQP